MSLFLLAWITSIPDTFLSVKASQKYIFDICIWLWVPIMIWIWLMWLKPKVNFSEQIPIFWFLIFSVVIYYLVLNIKKLNKNYSYILWFFYFIFVWYLVYISL